MNNQKFKTKFRSSQVWKNFRRYIKKKQKIDPITLSPLAPRATLHHLDLAPEHYSDISNEDHFLMLNKMSHDTIHFLYNILNRRELDDLMKDIRSILLKMQMINRGDL